MISYVTKTSVKLAFISYVGADCDSDDNFELRMLRYIIFIEANLPQKISNHTLAWCSSKKIECPT
jgi:hypothetical protein